MTTPDTDKLFAGSIPRLYDTHLVPLLFEPYAADLVKRLEPRSLVPLPAQSCRRRYCWIRPRTQSTSAWFGVALIPVGSLRTYQVVVQVTDWPEGNAA
jgi:hypothetical protein